MQKIVAKVAGVIVVGGVPSCCTTIVSLAICNALYISIASLNFVAQVYQLKHSMHHHHPPVLNILYLDTWILHKWLMFSSLPKNNSSPLKIDSWKRKCPFGAEPTLSGYMLVLGRVPINDVYQHGSLWRPPLNTTKDWSMKPIISHHCFGCDGNQPNQNIFQYSGQKPCYIPSCWLL